MEPTLSSTDGGGGAIAGKSVERAGSGVADAAAADESSPGEQVGLCVADTGIRVVVSPASPRAQSEPHRSQQRALFCCIDTETTGLSTALDRVVEIGAMLDDKQLAELGLQAVELPRHFQALVRPDILIPSRATKVHGISNEEVEKSQCFGRVRFNLCQWLNNWHEATGRDLILVAHNATYDREILIHETQRHCGQWSDLHHQAKWSCSLSAFRRRVRWRNAGLPALVKEYLPESYKHSAHRALGDCQALLDVLHALPESAEIWKELEASQVSDERS